MSLQVHQYNRILSAMWRILQGKVYREINYERPHIHGKAFRFYCFVELKKEFNQ